MLKSNRKQDYKKRKTKNSKLMNPKISFYCLAELMSDHLRSAHGYDCRIFLKFVRSVGRLDGVQLSKRQTPEMRSHNYESFGPDDE